VDNETHFAGREIHLYSEGDELGDHTRIAYRIAVEYEPESPWADVFASFVEKPGIEKVGALVIGAWGDVGSGTPPDAPIEALVGARDRLTGLRSLFFGDISMEESEISWIQQGDLAPVLSAYPKLEELRVRGGNQLSFGRLAHKALKTLVVETGGMDRSIVQQVGAADLPELEHLELWLGDDGYGANTTVADLAPILDGGRFPKLTTLGLRNCHYADDLAKAVASAPVLAKLKRLDLSLGTMTDEGGAALLASPGVKRLQSLDVHHHYMSEAMVAKLRAIGIEVDATERQETQYYRDEPARYVSVSE